MTAAQDVQSIPELLEQILSYVPPINLLKLKAVRRGWRALIKSSPVLQRRLFLQTDFVRAAGATGPVNFNLFLPQHQNTKRYAQLGPLVDLGFLFDKKYQRSTQWKRMFFTQPAVKVLTILIMEKFPLRGPTC